MDKEFQTLKAHWIGGQIDSASFLSAAAKLGQARAQAAMDARAEDVRKSLPLGWSLTRSPSGYSAG